MTSWKLSDLKKVKPNGIEVMSTFACGGGSSMGYKLAGCSIVAANDIDPVMARHYQRNLAPKHYFLCPINELKDKDLPDELYNLDILDGSPPCSTFSMAGNREDDWGKDKHFREGQAKQVLSDLFFDYLDLVEHLKPKVSVAENVKGMTIGKAKGYCKLIIERYKEIGYTPQLFLINAANCGVAQKRERVFFIAIRNDLYKSPLRLNPNELWVSAEAALDGLPPLSEAELDKLKLTPKTTARWHLTVKGENFGKTLERYGKKISAFNHTVLSPRKPACTLTSRHDNFYHWEAPRNLSFKEYARLGSFPDDYAVENERIGKYLIGMSVPPLMTKAVADAVIQQWLQPKIEA